jgi:hypothetical protein
MAMKKADFDASRANPIQLKNNNDGQHDRNFVVLGSTDPTHEECHCFEMLKLNTISILSLKLFKLCGNQSGISDSASYAGESQ